MTSHCRRIPPASFIVSIRRSASGNNDRAFPSGHCAFGTGGSAFHRGLDNRCLRTTSRMILAPFLDCFARHVRALHRGSSRAQERFPDGEDHEYVSLLSAHIDVTQPRFVSLGNYASSITAIVLCCSEHFDICRIRRRLPVTRGETNARSY